MIYADLIDEFQCPTEVVFCLKILGLSKNAMPGYVTFLLTLLTFHRIFSETTIHVNYLAIKTKQGFLLQDPKLCKPQDQAPIFSLILCNPNDDNNDGKNDDVDYGGDDDDDDDNDSLTIT